MDQCRPFYDRIPANETPDQKNERMSKPATELEKARYEMLCLVETTKLFYPEAIFEAVVACLPPITAEIVDIVSSEDAFLVGGHLRAQRNRESFSPLARRASNLLRERLDELKRLPD